MNKKSLRNNQTLRFFLRCAVLMVLMMASTMPAKAQHPFTLTTPDNVTNHTETLYWIESNGATGFYAIPHTNNSNVSTTNMPNLKALWYFMDAGIESGTQYYYIVNHNTGYYLKLDGTIGNDNTIKIASFGSGGDAYKFSIGGSEGEWILYPKSGNGNYWVNKKSGNVAYDRYLKSSNYGGSPDANSKWNYVARNSVTWAHPITNSTNSDKHYYKIQNATSKGSAYYMSIDDASDPYATVSDVDNNKRIWYFMEADSDNTIPNLKYYYIVNAVTGKYLKFTGTANGSSQTSSLQLYEHDGTETGETENRFQFMVLNAIGTTYSAYSIMPKLEINFYYDNQNTSLSPSNNYSNSLSNDMKIGIYNDRQTDNNYAHWLFVETNYVPVAVEAPVITFDNVNQEINITCGTAGASIYYTLDETTPDANSTPFTAAFSCTSPCTIKAIAVNSVFSSEVTTYNLQKVATPNFSLNTNTNKVTITSTAGASIYYSIGTESTPSVGVNPYNSPFVFPYAQSSQPLKAIAVKEGWINSEMGQQTITLNCQMPTFSFDNGNLQVTLSCDDAGATMYYTTNGSTPDPGQAGTTQYSGSFEVTSGSTVKAIATHSGYHNSQVAILPIAQSHDYSQDYLTLEIISGGTLKWKAEDSNATKTIEYSINNGTWTSITSTTDGATINVASGNSVRLRGTNTQYCNADKNKYTHLADGSATFNISGNIMSLTAGDNFANVTTLPGPWTFTQFFKQSKCISAENLILPATTMTDCCYRAMFSKCTTLEVAPALPATTLGAHCYYYMFEECAITSAPELLAPTLANYSYGYMFTNCTSLSYIKCLATTKSATNCLQNWVNGVSQTGTFVKDENTTWTTGASGIPTGWVVNDHLAPPDDPVITCDGDFITITCDTYGADIYYRLGQTGSYSLYSTPIVIHENTVVEAYAVKDELSSHIVSETCIAIKPYHFAGMEITPGPLYYGNNGYEIKEGWNYDSYNSIYGKTVGSTYFNFIELGQLFESSVFSTSDGDIEKVLDPLDGWRVPTNAEWASILGTTRSGSTVNGASNQHYSMIQLADVYGLLIFPDGETITGAELSDMDNTTPNGITESDLNEYLSQGCVFLPGCGYYDGSLQAWSDGLYYWSSTEYDSSTGHVSSGDNKNKETNYFPVYLVKGAADEATRLLKTWTYNGNTVEVPYSINAIDGHSSNYARNTFYFTTDVKIKELQPTYLWFQHADQSADIYVNNVKVTTHWGGYTSFFVDITGFVHAGDNNIKVALCNTKRNTLAPYTGDFNMNATLGEVKLISSPVVPSPDYGYDGFHITSTVTSASATITVKTSVPTDATVTCSIKGDNCDYSNTQTSTGEEITFTTTITNPHLWNGTVDPYLYDVTLTIAKDGVVYHKFERGYGLRFYEYVINQTVNGTSYTGFLLNGLPYLLRGVCMHNDLEGKANALTTEDIDNDFEILKELGCNFVRLAHYPHPKEVYDRCDKMGIIVQTEAPCVNDFYFEKTLDQEYYDHLYIQYEDMVRQHFNHPCIMFWGLGNEIKTDNTSTAKAQLEAYRTFIKAIDSERWVGYVVDHGKNNPYSSFGGPNMDWFGCNIYVGWYINNGTNGALTNDPTEQLNTRINNIINNNKVSKPLAFSEYGCGGTRTCHSDDFTATTDRGNKPRHDIEYQMWLHEGHIAAIKNKPELLFTSQWQLFDIAVFNRTEGYKVSLDGETVYDNNDLKRLNNKGLVERDHRTKKDPFYLYKAWWNENNDNNRFVHICGKDYEKLTNRVIKCYTNDNRPFKLYVNNVLKDTKSATIDTKKASDYIILFEAQDFEPGDVIKVEGTDPTIYDTFTFTDYTENYVFTANGNWNNAANWSPAVPAAARNVTINAACTIPKKYTAHVNNITIGNGSLTIADSAQLYHNNEGVRATVEKNITGYTVSQNQGESLTNGWYFIASPVTDDYTPTGSMVANTYDLYRLNNTTWENFKNTTVHSDFTTLENGTGYLYANSANVTLQFTGEIKPYTTANDAHLMIASGYNLIGNPYTFAAYIDKPYYSFNDERNSVLPNEIKNEAINTCTGVIVDGGENGVTVGFYKESQSIQAVNNGNIQMTLAQTITTRGNSNVETLDKAIVSFNKDNQLGKFYFGTQNANIYIPQNGEEFAIVSAQAQGEMPVNFKVNENGTYTITVNTEDVEMGYLHLIDNMTGADINLLSTPSYTFNAKSDDYASRFRLVFSANGINNEEANDDFAFVSNGQIIVKGEGTLQVIDMLGRQLYCREVHSSPLTPHSSFPTGVYVLRLVNGDNVKTQKIVIR